MKKPVRKFREEPGLAEVRRWRAQVFKEAGGTLEGLMKLLRESEAKRTATTPKPAPRRRKSA